MSYWKQHANIPQRESKQNRLFSALIRLNPAPDRLGSNHKPKKICVHIFQILQISALVQSDPAPKRVREQSEAESDLFWRHKGNCSELLGEEARHFLSPVLSTSNSELLVQLRKIFTSLTDLPDPFSRGNTDTFGPRPLLAPYSQVVNRQPAIGNAIYSVLTELTCCCLTYDIDIDSLSHCLLIAKFEFHLCPALQVWCWISKSTCIWRRR